MEINSKVDWIKQQVQAGNHRFTIHGFERCVERNISPREVKHAILSGEVIEDYPKDKYDPSCLIYGITQHGKILHVQCSIDPVWIITAYDPTLSSEEWSEDFKKRRAKP
ncbi:MAG: DUF4258 domain-containing protein [Deltaproteobacteria bacterium]|nr:DUF4258 domain-containing protein [Deltaproteobacteria bacterium]MBW1911200.1 DUF4258 domain-containing protein [Deltaproteobacteria bacterium]MBW2034746.1 DUF4258 domain-containing protein [Deltaproteobacteria bacterium]MBW2115857.1 DUF4258 domain-containing protein [Deltaproteobacteria bacterium]MBW2168744.1 DUF4258 domain-containing protein [Deltaproteobacteria bacterium]